MLGDGSPPKRVFRTLDDQVPQQTFHKFRSTQTQKAPQISKLESCAKPTARNCKQTKTSLPSLKKEKKFGKTFARTYFWVPVMIMGTLKVESEPVFDAAVSLRVAEVVAPAAKLVVVGVQEMLKYEPAFDGFQIPGAMDKVTAMVPVFLR